MKDRLLITVFLFSSLFLFSQDTPPDWKRKFPPRLYINEICIRPAKDGYPNWIELWNHTDKAVDLKNWSFKTTEGEFKIGKKFVVEPGRLSLILLYECGQKSEEFEKKLPPELPIIRFFDKKTFPYEYVSENVMEREREPIENILVLYDSEKNIKNLVFWGWNELKDWHEIIKQAQNKKVDAILADMMGKISVYLGCSMLLNDYDRLALLSYETSTPGRFYPKTLSTPPTVEVYFMKPPLPLYLYFSDPNDKGKPTGMDNNISFGSFYLYVDPAGYNQSIDSKNGWESTVYELCYDRDFKHPVIKNSSGVKFKWWTDWYFYIGLSFEDALYLSGKKLYCRAGRKHKDDTVLWSATKEFVMPDFADWSFAESNFGGLTLCDISKSACEINHLDDKDYLRKVNLLVSRLKKVVRDIGVFDVHKFPDALKEGGKMGHLKKLKISPDLSSVYMHIYLHNFRCLRQNPADSLTHHGSTNDFYKVLTPVRDFSFLRGFKNLRLDLSENDIPAMGGLGLVLRELNKYCKPKGLKLADTQLKDISALKGSTVEELDIRYNYYLNDISPLAGMPNLKQLNIEKLARREKIDMSPLASCPKLEVLKFTPEGYKNIEALKKIPSLRTINGEPSEEFFKNKGL